MNIVSVSFGKDSLAMLLLMIANKVPVDEVVFYDTGMEFQAIYDTRDRVKDILVANSIRYVELKPEKTFEYNMFERPVNGKNGLHYGYSWCGGPCRWGTTEKLRAMDKYAEERNANVYVGIAFDETKRLIKERKDYKIFPLAEWHYTELDCLNYCYKNGFYWNEGGIRLYDLLDRVSCWCCTNKNLKELKNIYFYLPEYWQRLKDIQSRLTRPMKGKGKSVFDLESRFERETSNTIEHFLEVGL